MFTDYEIEHLPEDPIGALKEICDRFLRGDSSVQGEEHVDRYEDYLKSLALVVSILEGYGLDHEVEIPKIVNDVYEDCQRIANFIAALRKEIKERSAPLTYEAQRALLAVKINRGFYYEFTDGDLKRLQTLINELRDLTEETENLTEDHRRRLLAKLERLQMELHKKVSDIDRFYGLVGDAGVMLGKFGAQAKPFVDRIRELIEIIWRTQSKREELPNNSPPPILPEATDDQPSTITVGRPVTRPPPYRSRRAELPHRAPRSYSLRTQQHWPILRNCGRCVVAPA